MTDIVRILAGTKIAVRPDGKWFPVDDDDPRAVAYTPSDIVIVDGVFTPTAPENSIYVPLNSDGTKPPWPPADTLPDRTR